MSTLLNNRTIMIVDDDPDTCDLLRYSLEQAGASVLVAQTVDAAIETFRRSPAHAVIADMRIRDSDGYTLIKAIRDHNTEYRGFTPAVAVTGFASPDDEKRAIDAGFNAYISKPFDPADVISAVARSLRGPSCIAA
jgi:CheY-like chemotaxis protein